MRICRRPVAGIGQRIALTFQYRGRRNCARVNPYALGLPAVWAAALTLAHARSIRVPPRMRDLSTMRVAPALLLLIGTTLPALAGGGFDIVIPGRAGVPIMINGVDASYAVVEGEWGLGQNTHVQPTVYGGRLVDPPNVGHYYPSAGHMPGYGRLEIQPPANRKLPQPAQSYHKSWSVQSAQQPAQNDVPAYPPPVIVAPENGAVSPHDPQNPPHDFRHRNHRKFRH